MHVTHLVTTSGHVERMLDFHERKRLAPRKRSAEAEIRRAIEPILASRSPVAEGADPSDGA